MDASYVAIITSIITSATTLSGIFLNERLKKLNKPSLSDPDFEDMLKPIMDHILLELNARRVEFFEGKNGNNTLSGYHLKTLNLVAESTAPDIEIVKNDFQDVSIDIFRRTIKILSNSKDGYAEFLEYQQTDNEGLLHQKYGNNVLYCLKIFTKQNRWTSILMVGFEDINRRLTLHETVWLKMQASRMGVILKKI